VSLKRKNVNCGGIREFSLVSSCAGTAPAPRRLFQQKVEQMSDSLAPPTVLQNWSYLTLEVIMKFLRYGALALLCVIGLNSAADAYPYYGWHHHYHHHRYWW
jgi:hypothetical protein